MTSPTYILGHADLELERLKLQASLIEDITRRLVARCGISPGMRVLDIGCGVGDVSMLLAEAVGPTGSVVAIDRERRAVEMARARASAAGHCQIDFKITSEHDLPDELPFDAAIGRYVLVHQPDPSAVVRRAASKVRSGGIIAFHEPALYIMGHTWPPIALYQRIVSYMVAAFRSQLQSYDVGGHLISCFQQAGLPSPHPTWEAVVGGSDSPVFRWSVLTFQSLLPHIQAMDLSSNEIDIDKLEETLRSAAEAMHAQIVSTPQCCAWSRRP